MNVGALLGLDLDVPMWIVLILANIAAYYIYMTWNFNAFKKLDIPGPSPIPVFGNLREISAKGLRNFELDNARKYGKIYGMFYGRIPSLTVADPEILKHILVKDFSKFTNRQIENMAVKENLLAACLPKLKDDHWKHVRHFLSHSFSASKLKMVQAQILKCSDQMVENIREASKNEEGFELKQFTEAFAMDVIAYTTYGVELDSHKDPDHIFARMSKKFIGVSLFDWRVVLLFFFPFLRGVLGRLFPFVPLELDNFFLKITRDVLEDRKSGVAKKQKDFIQMMADSLTNQPTERDLHKDSVQKDAVGLVWTKEGLTEREIAANAIIFMAGGFENTAVTMSLLVHALATHPEVQQTLIDEVDSKLHGQEPKYEDVAELTYMQQVLEEIMRLYPLAPRVERTVKEDITINGVHFVKGTQVGIPFITLNMDPDVWPDPEKFDPDRFSEEVKATRDPGCFMPFGMGPRNCVGLRLALLEIKIALTRLLQNFTFEPCSKTEMPLKLLKARTTPENGVYLSAKPRKIKSYILFSY